MKLHKQSAVEIREKVLNKEVSAVEVAEQALDNAAAADKPINSFVRLHEETALSCARTVDEKLKNNVHPGRLAGVPIAIKDNMCEIGLLTTSGSKILDGFRPPYTATAVEKCLAEGAIPLGKTNMDEFAMGSSCETSFYGPDRKSVV